MSTNSTKNESQAPSLRDSVVTFRGESKGDSEEIKRMRFRAWHRGTREADYLVGGFFDHYYQQWDSRQRAWFAILLDCEDVDILDWAMSRAAPPAVLDQRDMIAALQRLDYIPRP